MQKRRRSRGALGALRQIGRRAAARSRGVRRSAAGRGERLCVGALGGCRLALVRSHLYDPRSRGGTTGAHRTLHESHGPPGTDAERALSFSTRSRAATSDLAPGTFPPRSAQPCPRLTRASSRAPCQGDNCCRDFRAIRQARDPSFEASRVVCKTSRCAAYKIRRRQACKLL